MKKILLLLLALGVLSTGMAFARTDKCSQDYLKNRKHFAVINPLAEGIAERVIRSSLKKDTGANFKVKFTGYTLSSMKKGIFKHLEITGKDVIVEQIPIPYVHLKTLSDYNYVDYTKDPVEFKSDMTFAYDLELSEQSMNAALKRSEYKYIIDSVSKLAYPMFQVMGVNTKIRNNKLYILTEYNFPIAPASKNKVFIASSDFKVVNGKIKAVNVKLDSAYGKVSLDRVANLLNLLNPLEFTLEMLDSKKCKGKIENVNIMDNKVKINGKIFVEGD